jgi:hypothetical protein
MKHPERVTQNHICLMLTHHKICYSVTDASRSFGKDGRPRPSKVREGWPDITGVYRGKFFGLEVKSKIGYASAIQKSCHNRIRANGGFVKVVRSWEDALLLLKEIYRCDPKAPPPLN